MRPRSSLNGKPFLIAYGRHGETSGHRLISASAHAVDLSLWQEVQGFGIAYLSVSAGAMNRNVCA